MKDLWQILEQWFSAFPTLRPFNTVPNVVVTPSVELFLLLLHNCHFATAVNHNVNILCFMMVLGDP